MKYLTSLVFVISAALFYSVNISPELLPLSGLIPLLIPVFLILNIILCLLLALSKKKLFVVPLLAIILGWKFIGVTLQLNSDRSEKEGISVLSYNVHMFNYKQAEEPDIRPDILQWIGKQDADVMAFQEFYQDSSSSTNAIDLLRKDGTYDYAMQVVEEWPGKRFFGLAVFSKYPIINRGTLFENRKTNGAMFADIKIERDTIRVYNAHLESMNIPAGQLSDIEGIKQNYDKTLEKINKGTVNRSTQVDELTTHIQHSPYPVLLMGDFNDVPYSYTYFSIRNLLENAFESAGNGFGFTFNRVLFFLRIDNIFYSKGFEALRFNTLREADYSDHYPIQTVFRRQPLILQETD